MRRIRAIAVFAIVWGVAWAPVGLLAAIRHVVLGNVPLDRHLALFIAFLVALTTVLGLVAGSAFGAALLLAARGRPLSELPQSLVVVAVGIVGFLLGAAIEPGYMAAVVFGILGAGTALGSLLLAQRSESNARAT